MHMSTVRGTGIRLFFLLCLVASRPAALQAAEKAAPQDGVPVIQFAELKHDFGQVNQNSELRHTFTFKNTGTAVLKIENVKAG